MKNSICTFLFFTVMLPVLSYAQRSGVPDEIRIWTERNRDSMIYGMGISEDPSEQVSLQQAIALARSDLAGNLRAKVESLESNIISINTNNNTRQRNEEFATSTKQQIEATLEKQERFGPWYNEKGATYVIQYVKLKDLRSLYDSRIQGDKDILESVLVKAEWENEPLYKNRDLRKARRIADTVKKNIDLLRGIDPSQEYPGLNSLLQDIQTEYEKSQAFISFKVMVHADSGKNGEIRTDAIEKEIERLFRRSVYNTTKKDAVYTVTANISTDEDLAPNGNHYVNAEIEIYVQNADKKSLFSYPKSYTHIGTSSARHSWDSAYTQAATGIKNDMQNFIAKLNTFIENGD